MAALFCFFVKKNEMVDQRSFGSWKLKNWHKFSNEVLEELNAPNLMFFNEKKN